MMMTQRPEDPENFKSLSSDMTLIGMTGEYICSRCGKTNIAHIDAKNLNGCDIMVSCPKCGALGAIYFDDLFGDAI